MNKAILSSVALHSVAVAHRRLHERTLKSDRLAQKANTCNMSEIFSEPSTWNNRTLASPKRCFKNPCEKSINYICFVLVLQCCRGQRAARRPRTSQCRATSHLRSVESLEHALKRSAAGKLHVHNLEICLKIQGAHDVV